jgi:hypothetical protein
MFSSNPMKKEKSFRMQSKYFSKIMKSFPKIRISSIKRICEMW